MSDLGFDETLAFARARVGSTLNYKWHLDRLLGVGGMAAVYEATHRNRKRAAIKLLHPEFSMNAAVRDRFLREGYVANSVGHAGAVSVDDDDVAEDGCAFLVMELLDGETLDARWERKGKRLAPEEVLSLVDQVLSTLHAAHAAGIVHRDLKPENLFLTRAGTVKVLDFGIARVRELSQSASKTQTGSMMGTPAFMPPEQARGRWDEVDARSDLWAVGATMFTLLTGHFVHEANTVNEAVAFAVTQPARSVAALVPDLPFPIVELIDRALAYDRGERWSSAATMQSALRRAYAGLEAAALEAGSPPLKPITLETFEDETSVATGAVSAEANAETSRQANELDGIPHRPSPTARPGALTTARGVTQNTEKTSGHKRNRSKSIALGALALLVLLVLTWFGVRWPTPMDTSTASQASGSVITPSVSSRPTAQRAAPSSVEPAHVSLDQLPVLSPRQPERSSRPLPVEVEAQHRAAPQIAPIHSGRDAVPAGSPKLNPPPSDDPFASRQ